MITESQYSELKRNVETAKTQADKAAGALNQLMRQLKDEFGCSSLKEAKSMLEELESKRDAAQRKFETAFKDYQSKWKTDESD